MLWAGCQPFLATFSPFTGKINCLWSSNCSGEDGPRQGWPGGQAGLMMVPGGGGQCSAYGGVLGRSAAPEVGYRRWAPEVGRRSWGARGGGAGGGDAARRRWGRRTGWRGGGAVGRAVPP